MYLRAAIDNEPDRAAAGVGFGPRILFSTAALEASGLVKPGTLYETEYRLRVPETVALDEMRETLEANFPDAGWRWRDRRNGAPGVERVVLRLGAFLTLVGLAALAGGRGG